MSVKWTTSLSINLHGKAYKVRKGVDKVEFIETGDAKDYGANIALFAEDGYDVIVTVGFAMGEATAEAAATYPDIDFIGVDQFQEKLLTMSPV